MARPRGCRHLPRRSRASGQQRSSVQRPRLSGIHPRLLLLSGCRHRRPLPARAFPLRSHAKASLVARDLLLLGEPRPGCSALRDERATNSELGVRDGVGRNHLRTLCTGPFHFRSGKPSRAPHLLDFAGNGHRFEYWQHRRNPAAAALGAAALAVRTRDLLQPHVVHLRIGRHGSVRGLLALGQTAGPHEDCGPGLCPLGAARSRLLFGPGRLWASNLDGTGADVLVHLDHDRCGGIGRLHLSGSACDRGRARATSRRTHRRPPGAAHAHAGKAGCRARHGPQRCIPARQRSGRRLLPLPHPEERKSAGGDRRRQRQGRRSRFDLRPAPRGRGSLRRSSSSLCA